jgi:hypothetical protein
LIGVWSHSCLPATHSTKLAEGLAEGSRLRSANTLETQRSQPVTRSKHIRNRGDTGDFYRYSMASPASIDATNHPAPSPLSQPSPAQVLLAALVERKGRVVTRTELARVLGLRTDQTRRIDAMLVEVRRELTQQGLELVNVRSRGWMITDANHS